MTNTSVFVSYQKIKCLKMLIKFAVKRECTVLLGDYIVANLVELNKLQSFANVVEARAFLKLRHSIYHKVPIPTNAILRMSPLSFGCSFNQKSLAEGKAPPCTNYL